MTSTDICTYIFSHLIITFLSKRRLLIIRTTCISTALTDRRTTNMKVNKHSLGKKLLRLIRMMCQCHRASVQSVNYFTLSYNFHSQEAKLRVSHFFLFIDFKTSSLHVFVCQLEPKLDLQFAEILLSSRRVCCRTAVHSQQNQMWCVLEGDVTKTAAKFDPSSKIHSPCFKIATLQLRPVVYGYVKAGVGIKIRSRE